MAREIERKFLVKKLPAIPENIDNHVIQQGYIFISEKMEIRIRKIGGIYFQTIKTGEGLSRGEYEIELSSDHFDLLWPLTEGKRVEKTRFEIEYANRLIELDIYSGNLEGLYTAEVEFPSETKSKKFTPPEWFGEEITLDSRYKNKNLALLRIPPS